MLLLRIERYLRTRRMAPTRFGRDALGDPWLVADLREGRQLRPVTAAKLSAYLDRVEAEQRPQAGGEAINKVVVTSITPATAVPEEANR